MIVCVRVCDSLFPSSSNVSGSSLVVSTTWGLSSVESCWCERGSQCVKSRLPCDCECLSFTLPQHLWMTEFLVDDKGCEQNCWLNPAGWRTRPWNTWALTLHPCWCLSLPITWPPLTHTLTGTHILNGWLAPVSMATVESNYHLKAFSTGFFCCFFFGFFFFGFLNYNNNSCFKTRKKDIHTKIHGHLDGGHGCY